MTGALYSAAEQARGSGRQVMSDPTLPEAAVLATMAADGLAVLAVYLDASPSVTDAGGRSARVGWANPAALELLGQTEDELLGPLPAPGPVVGEQPHWSAVVSDLLDRIGEYGIGEHGIGESGLGDDGGWVTAAGDSRPGAPASVALRLRVVGPDSAVVWLRPVVPAVQLAEEAQRESEHRFRSLAEHAPVGIVLSEAGLRLGFVNDRFAEIAGIDRHNLVGTRWLQVIHPEDLPGLLETLDEVLAGAPVETTVRMVSVVNSQRWVQIRLSPVTTPRRSAGFIGTVEDITARHAWETQLTYQAGHDALTGLANRRNLVEQLTDLLCSRRSRDRDAAVLFCDLDGFKRINDTLGHDAGDRVLIEVGQRLTTTARDEDLVARIAGDEFVVLIRGIGDYAAAEAAAGRQLRALLPPIRVAGDVVTVSASVGIAMARDHDSAAALLQAADRGMYEAKRSGHGQYRLGSAAPAEARR